MAKLLKLSRIRFYENGVTSINLPIATELLGTRASRTTHPQVLHYFNELFSLITEDEFKVENPFALKTKTEVVSLLGKENCEELIKETVSCSGTRHSIKTKRHCCSCTQCIDRRFATLANGYERFDPESLYSLDLLTGPREPGEQRALALSFVKKALEIEDMTEHGFFREFGEASRAVDYLDGRTGENAEKIFNLYNRHAEVVSRVMEEGIQRHTKALLRHELPDSCLLVMAVDYSKPSLSPEVIKPGKTFPSPEDSTWKEVVFIINSETSLKIKVRDITKTYTFSDLGFKDERKGDLPDTLWILLLHFAEHNGDISWENNPFQETKANLKHAISRLRKRLKEIMVMDEDPLYPYHRQTESSYRLKFKIIDERYR